MQNQIQAQKLFFASRVALVATAMTFAIRANLIGTIGTAFHIPAQSMGIVLGTAFWGFTLSMIAGGSLCDLLGMKRLLIFAFAGHLAGLILTMMATGFMSLFISTLLVGIGNGFVEAACNPLVATLYPDKKTEKLNKFHVWFPGGIVIGGLVAYIFDFYYLPWQWQIASILLPVFLYGILFFSLKFPFSERVSSGVSGKEMLKECSRPLFIFMVLCMLLTSATELGTNQWIAELLGNVGVPSILLLVFINGLMALGRSFAGPIEHAISPIGMLISSAVFSAMGLYLLAISTGYSSFAAAAVFAIGICFFWPTMLGFVAEYLPKTGALGLSVMGGAGMLSVSFILPFIGSFYEAQILNFLPQGISLTQLSSTSAPANLQLLNTAKLLSGAATLRYVAIIPTILIVLFGIVFLVMRKQNRILN